jgi:hypothetical protein
MNLKSRIESILNAPILSAEITGIPTFLLSELQLEQLPKVTLPKHRRLGHLAERVVSELIKASTNYKMLYENLQIIQHKNTIGELDFIIQHKTTQKIIHVEFAYKFYLYDPSISSESTKNWIGPNRKDTLYEKLEKLQQKQFPLLYHEATKAKVPELDVATISQQLCLLVYLFLPYASKLTLNAELQAAVKGYYMDFETFCGKHHDEKMYYIPSKKEWGIDPATHETWNSFKIIKEEIKQKLSQKHAPKCWMKHGNSFELFFIVWW